MAHTRDSSSILPPDEEQTAGTGAHPALIGGLFLLGTLAGVLLMGALRFTMQPAHAATHYHANWAVYVNGQRLDLSADRYMEDVASCRRGATSVAPEDRVHLHGNDQDAVHVHADGATWGHLAANLGFGLGDDYLFTDTGGRVFAESGRSLKFIVDGTPVTSIRNRAIQGGERLLISYGPESVAEVLRTQFPSVAATAPQLDRVTDPGSCGGAATPDAGDRFRRAFWF